MIFTLKVFQIVHCSVQGGGQKWDSRTYVMKHRAEGQDGLLLARALQALAYPVGYGAH